MNDDRSTVEICRAQDAADARSIEAALKEAGIECRVVGNPSPEDAASGPSIEVPAARLDAARQLLRDRAAADSVYRVNSWTCPKCGAEVEAEFSSCWNCLYCPAAC